MVPEPSAVGTIVSGDAGLVFFHWSLRDFTRRRFAWPRSLALSAFLCSHSHWRIWLLVLKALCGHRHKLSDRSDSRSNLTRHPSVFDPRPAQPLQPGVAPNFATTLYTCRCPDGPWACCVNIVAFRVPHLLQLADHESLFKARGAVISLSGLRSPSERCARLSWALCPPRTPSLIQIARWHGCVLVHQSFSKWQHLARVGLPQRDAKCSSAIVFHLGPRQAPCCVAKQPSYQDAVARQLFLQEILK